MRVQTAGTWSAGCLSLGAGAAFVIWQNQPWIAEIALIGAVVVFIGTWGWWGISKLLRKNHSGEAPIRGLGVGIQGGAGHHGPGGAVYISGGSGGVGGDGGTVILSGGDGARIQNLPPAPLYDFPIRRAIEYVAAWIGETSDDKKFWPKTRQAIRQAALDSKIKIRGRKQIDTHEQYRTIFRDVYSDIPATYWENSAINVLATDQQFEDGDHTEPESMNAKSWGKEGILAINKYAGLRMNLDEIKREWPAKT